MNAIVTGGAQGIGAAVCVALLKKGYKVCVADIHETKGLEFVKEQQKIFGEGNAIFSVCDVRKESDLTKTFDIAVSAFQAVDLLVNNAGFFNEKCPKDMLDVNVMGSIIGCQLALKYMGKSNGGKGGMVVNMSSILGLIPYWKIPVYATSKHALVGLTRCYGLPEHEQRDGVIFAALCPGMTNTCSLNSGGEDYSQRPELMSADFVAKGMMKLLEDRINGSTLVVTKALGYRYMECKKEIDNLPIQ
ncbi:hypothetical protein JTE90_005078 [Oedothorax gibbosus]|uniref:15-hydroxyprostaglandin dehydrogenase [NAD(+)] n=1 Tax=Oedothorax gibbosus TaxID=931172 RepID=A0AAV6VAK0_9ARAC|nr:hypothetical protein JTE90_005078 [Oedothorax gibbosus]